MINWTKSCPPDTPGLVAKKNLKMFYCVGVPWGPGGNSEKTRILAIDACLMDHQSNRMGSHSKKLVLTPIFSA